MIRLGAAFAGIAGLLAATWAAIEAAGLTGSHAGLTWAIAGLVTATSMVMGRASAKEMALGVAFILCCEGYGFILTAERITAIRDAKSAAIVAATRIEAARVARIEAASKALGTYSDQALIKISEKGCADRCKAEIDDTKKSLRDELDKARAVEPTKGAGQSPSPLADRLGISAWSLDLTLAFLLSFGANGTSCFLIAWGAHAPPQLAGDPDKLPEATIATPAKVEPAKEQSRPVPSPRDHVAEFLKMTIRPSAAGEAPMKALFQRYEQWSEGKSMRLEPAALGREMQALFKAANLTCVAKGGDWVVRGAVVA